MKVVVDEDTGKTFAQALRDLLEPEGATVARSVDVGWRGKKNGELLALAQAHSYTHLVSSDKMMAEEHQPSIPVLLVDQMANADVERIRRTALAVAGLLFDNPPNQSWLLRGVRRRLRTGEAAPPHRRGRAQDESRAHGIPRFAARRQGCVRPK